MTGEAVIDGSAGCLPVDEEQRLLWAAREGDSRAFEALARRHWEKVTAVCGMLLRDPDEVQDAVQETFIRAYQNLHRFRGDAAFQTWLLRIAVNYCRGQHLTFWNRRVWVAPDEALIARAGAQPDASLQVENSLLRAEVVGVLRSLPERLTLPYVLHVFEDLSGAEIAAVLGWSESTVWTRIYAARLRVRKKLSAYLG